MNTTLNKTLRLTGLALAGLMSFSVQANQAKQLQVDNPFVREMPPVAPATAAFMTLINAGDQPIAVVRADSDAAKTVELHTHIDDNGVMRMREIPEISVPAIGQTELKPGGLHVMLIGPTRALTEGDIVDIKLIMQDGSEKMIQAPVRKIMGMGMNRPAGSGQGMMHKHH
ncbi:copper chaperone PCu(A)C [Thiomicrospira sp. R3]|uniref:copper chaperone PCu(A)C n=1 Tax=Thiomicrospira sp. R3 TaxID=3035472 RepID=UPI00259B8B87|nr:copper chaperone PCu(A)C [Thiomicrospira sp. R3]WFE67853.1 copper chaperone PCu(A)C [Thiomicrospira sp. R3]